MKKFAYFFPLLLILVYTQYCLAQGAPSNEQLFKQGVQSYQTKKYSEAVSSFEQALKNQPNDTNILANLGLTHFQMGQLGLSIAYFRRTLALDPSNPTATAGLKYSTSKLVVKELPRRIDLLESLHAEFLSQLTLQTFLFLTLCLLVISSLLWIQWLSKKKLATQAGEALPPISVPSMIISLICLLFSMATVLKISENSTVRATVIKEKNSVRSGPDENSVELFELPWGLEVIARQTQGDWIQITYPGGASGWIKKEAMMLTTGDSL